MSNKKEMDSNSLVIFVAIITLVSFIGAKFFADFSCARKCQRIIELQKRETKAMKKWYSYVRKRSSLASFPLLDPNSPIEDWEWKYLRDDEVHKQLLSDWVDVKIELCRFAPELRTQETGYLIYILQNAQDEKIEQKIFNLLCAVD